MIPSQSVRWLRAGVAALLAVSLAATQALAQTRKVLLIRDAEIENSIRAFATPIFAAAGLDGDSIRLHIVSDPSLNAFVAGGQRIFVNTGLIMRTRQPGQLIGVLAHETGHIAGGHVARLPDAMNNATAESVLAVLLGVAVGVATGRGDAAAAIMMGGQGIAQRGFLAYTRAQESTADQAALTYLERSGQSSQGLLEFLTLLVDQELLHIERQDPYVRSHPVTAERVATVRALVERSRFSRAEGPPEFVELHRRMRAKLIGFVEPAQRVFQTYKEGDPALEARYARATAYYRQGDLGRALPLIDGLIAERPQDPYFHELRGQMLFENRRAAEALASYEQAVRYMPQSPLLRLGLAQVQIEMNDPALIKAAINHLIEAARYEPSNGQVWHQLAIGYGRDGQIGMAALALAEEASVQNRKTDARQQATRAEGMLPRGSPAWLRAQDIKNAAARTND